MSLLARTRELLASAGLSPKKSFGQNFLISEHVVARIAEACVPEAEVGKTKVLELGAGLGFLTEALAARAGQVVCVERDRDLVPILERQLGDRVKIVEADAATVEPRELLGDVGVLAGNLPYQITGRLIELSVHNARDLTRAVFMVQLEVADRLAAGPGSKTYGALSVFTQAAFEVEKLFDVPRESFHPAPDITSAVVRLTPRFLAEETDIFRAVVKGAYSMRRKTLRNAWGRLAEPRVVAAAAERAGISLDARGETLSVEQFARMAAEMAETAETAETR